MTAELDNSKGEQYLPDERHPYLKMLNHFVPLLLPVDFLVQRKSVA